MKQNTYLLGLIQVDEVAQRRHGTYDDAAESRRQTTICYTVPTGKADHVQVCRNTFFEIFALSHCKVQGLVKKKKLGSNMYMEITEVGQKVQESSPKISVNKSLIISIPFQKKKTIIADLNQARSF